MFQLTGKPSAIFQPTPRDRGRDRGGLAKDMME